MTEERPRSGKPEDLRSTVSDGSLERGETVYPFAATEAGTRIDPVEDGPAGAADPVQGDPPGAGGPAGVGGPAEAVTEATEATQAATQPAEAVTQATGATEATQAVTHVTQVTEATQAATQPAEAVTHVTEATQAIHVTGSTDPAAPPSIPPRPPALRVVVLAGGYGGAKLTHGLALAAEAREAADRRALDVSVVVNTGDDLELHGLLVSPDIDTVMYTLAGWANTETGWGVRAETWSNAEMLGRYGAPTWFRLGDRDLATHLLRTQRIRAGLSLTAVTAELTTALGIRTRVLPMADTLVRTRILTDEGWLEFQEYFVERHHQDPVHEIRFEGIEEAHPTLEVMGAIAAAHVVMLAPSNPFVSIGPILGLPGVLGALHEARARGIPIIGVSPIVGGAALRGPADRMFESLGGEASATGVARLYAERYPGLLTDLVIDDQDDDSASDIASTGIRPLVTPTVMRTDDDRRRLAERLLEEVESAAPPVALPLA